MSCSGDLPLESKHTASAPSPVSGEGPVCFSPACCWSNMTILCSMITS
jgi:hypothetical protein